MRHLHREIWEKRCGMPKSEDFIERKDHIISLLRHVEQMDLSEMLAVIKDLGTRKDEVRDYIDLGAVVPGCAFV